MRSIGEAINQTKKKELLTTTIPKDPGERDTTSFAVKSDLLLQKQQNGPLNKKARVDKAQRPSATTLHKPLFDLSPSLPLAPPASETTK